MTVADDRRALPGTMPDAEIGAANRRHAMGITYEVSENERSITIYYPDGSSDSDMPEAQEIAAARAAASIANRTGKSVEIYGSDPGGTWTKSVVEPDPEIERD